MGKVTALPKGATDAPAKAEEIVPPFEIAVAANFEQLQQLHIRMPVKDPITRTEANRLIDLASDLAQRQVSRMEIRVNEAALKDKKKALDLQQKRRVEQEEHHAAALAAIEDEIVRLTTRHAELEQKDRSAWTATGRSPDNYKPQGACKNRLDGIGRDIEAQRAQVGTLTAEYEQKVAKAQADIVERLTE